MFKDLFKVILKKSTTVLVDSATARDTMVKWVSPYPIDTIW